MGVFMKVQTTNATSQTNGNRNLIKKGLFALAAVAVIGTTSSVYAAVNETDNTTSGYGSSGENALAAIDMFNQSFDTQSAGFQADVYELVGTVRTELEATDDGDSADQFAAVFGTASSAYDDQVNDAADDFRAAIQSAASTAESKDQFIDRFNNAKAQYFNDLDAAKNQFAAAVSNLGDGANQSKDRFIGGYNSTRDAYGNELEAIKNNFAATIG